MVGMWWGCGGGRSHGGHVMVSGAMVGGGGGQSHGGCVVVGGAMMDTRYVGWGIELCIM